MKIFNKWLQYSAIKLKANNINENGVISSAINQPKSVANGQCNGLSALSWLSASYSWLRLTGQPAK